ncbi:MAG: hypothetical protein SNJ59_02065 [Aggregatilineales bacterium]
MTAAGYTLLDLLSAFGATGIGIALILLGQLSRRLGETTGARRYYLGFFAAAGLLFTSAGAQIINVTLGLVEAEQLVHAPLWITLYNGLPAAGVSLGLYFAWRYWSWLLAETD